MGAYSSVSRDAIPFEIQGVSTIVETPGKLTDEQKALCMQLWGREVPKADADLFFAQCEHFGLSPFAVGQMWGVPRRVGGQWRLISQVGINGHVLIASRSGQYLGMTDPQWCRLRRLPGTDSPDPEAQEVWRGSWNFEQPPDAARVGVWRRGAPTPLFMVANFREYAEYVDEWEDGRRTGRKRLTDMWARMPANQLAKCAGALALRRCFQQEFSGLRAAFSAVEVPPAAPPARISDLYPEEPAPSAAGDGRAVGLRPTLSGSAGTQAGQNPLGSPPAPPAVNGGAEQPQLCAPTDDITTNTFWGKATELGREWGFSRGDVHRLLGLEDRTGALKEWVQDGNSYAAALADLERAGKAAYERREREAWAEGFAGTAVPRDRPEDAPGVH
jgi:hypothetical protein